MNAPINKRLTCAHLLRIAVPVGTRLHRNWHLATPHCGRVTAAALGRLLLNVPTLVLYDNTAVRFAARLADSMGRLPWRHRAVPSATLDKAIFSLCVTIPYYYRCFNEICVYISRYALCPCTQDLIYTGAYTACMCFRAMTVHCGRRTQNTQHTTQDIVCQK